MLNKFVKNRKGTAEVIGSVLFIIMLLFFFTNVYLWHDSATKQMNDHYSEKTNSLIDVTLMTNPYTLNVTNKGGVDATLTMLWINVRSSGSIYENHLNHTLNIVVPAGMSKNITLTGVNLVWNVPLTFKIITSLGNSAACSYSPP
jgi:hypothetical protein